MKSPKKPKATTEEKALRARTMRELDRTQDKENRLRKMIAFGRLGTRQLLSGGAAGILDGRAPVSDGAASGRGTSGGSAQGTSSGAASSPWSPPGRRRRGKAPPPVPRESM